MEKSQNITRLKNYLENTFNLEYLSSNNIYNFEVEDSIFNKNQNDEIDKLEEYIKTDRNLIDELIRILTIMIDKTYYQKNKHKKGKQKTHSSNSSNNSTETESDNNHTHLVNKGKNALYNHYIFTTPARVDIIKNTINKPNFKLSIGEYVLTKKDFSFQMISKGKIDK